MPTEKLKPNLIRPGTLVQVRQLVRDGEKLRFVLRASLTTFTATRMRNRVRGASPEIRA